MSEILSGRIAGAARSRWLDWLARFGLAAQGVSYAVVAVLALKLALGDGGKATSRQGAFQTLAGSTLGTLLLVLLALGFVGYALWRFAAALLDRDDEGSDAKGLAKRAGDFAKGAIYVGLTVSVVKVLSGSGGGGGGGGQKQAAGVLGWPGGKWLVGAAGLAVIGAALWNLYRGLARTFEQQLRTGQMSERERTWVGRVGAAGLSARAVVFGVIGWFLLKAALTYDPQKAIGLGGALAKLAQAPYGAVVLGVTAAGLLAFALFCVAQAKYREV